MRQPLYGRRPGRAALFIIVVIASVCNGAVSADNEDSTYLAPSAVVPYGAALSVKEHRVSSTGGEETYSLILSSGDEVLTALTDFAKRHTVVDAHFIAIGAVHDVKVGWLDLDRKEYKVIPVQGQVEVLSLIGDIGVAGAKPIVHAHAVLGLPDGSTRGGHLMHAVASPTLEVFITTSKVPLNKAPDPATGMTLFQ
jgi:predicted DNA-binding protein with PD1-like motif